MKKFMFLIIVLALANAFLWGYNIGHLDAPQPHVDHRLANMREVQCDDIVSSPNADTGKRDLVCEITLRAEDDNVIIFKGPGTYEERSY